MRYIALLSLGDADGIGNDKSSVASSTANYTPEYAAIEAAFISDLIKKGEIVPLTEALVLFLVHKAKPLKSNFSLL